MDENSMSNILNQFKDLIDSNQIPDNVKEMFENLKSNSSSEEKMNENGNQSPIESNSNSLNSNFDINTIIKIKSIVDQMNSSNDDPRANLLNSLKPYLNESRKSKVDQYISIFKMSKVFEIMNLTNEENNHE